MQPMATVLPRSAKQIKQMQHMQRGLQMRMPQQLLHQLVEARHCRLPSTALLQPAATLPPQLLLSCSPPGHRLIMRRIAVPQARRLSISVKALMGQQTAQQCIVRTAAKACQAQRHCPPGSQRRMQDRWRSSRAARQRLLRS